MARYVRKSSPEALEQALEKLVMISPNKKTYDEMTSLMFQLYCGNDFGLGNFSLAFLDKIEVARSTRSIKKCTCRSQRRVTSP